MTSTTTFHQSPPSSLADRRRFRQALAGAAGAAVITAGASVGMATAAQASVADHGNAAAIQLPDQYYGSSKASAFRIVDAA